MDTTPMSDGQPERPSKVTFEVVGEVPRTPEVARALVKLLLSVHQRQLDEENTD